MVITLDELRELFLRAADEEITQVYLAEGALSQVKPIVREVGEVEGTLGDRFGLEFD